MENIFLCQNFRKVGLFIRIKLTSTTANLMRSKNTIHLLLIVLLVGWCEGGRILDGFLALGAKYKIAKDQKSTRPLDHSNLRLETHFIILKVIKLAV
jgi:hypothetical protein